MKRLYTAALLAALSLAALSSAALRPAEAGEGTNTSASAIGSTVEDFKLPDASGKEHSLASLKGPKGTVLIFVATKCPVSNGYNERMEKLANDYKSRGFTVVGINSNKEELPDEIKRHAADNGLTFTILKDAGNRVADRLDAQVTPEAYVLDASNKLVYRGRIDNSRDGASITASELRDAIEALLAGRPVEKSEVRAFGCSIKRA